MEKFDSPGNSADSPNYSVRMGGIAAGLSFDILARPMDGHDVRGRAKAQPASLGPDSLKEAYASAGIGSMMERFDSPGNSADSSNHSYRMVEMGAGVSFEIDALRPPPGGWSR